MSEGRTGTAEAEVIQALWVVAGRRLAVGMSFGVLKRMFWYGTIKCYCIRSLLQKKEAIFQKRTEIGRKMS